MEASIASAFLGFPVLRAILARLKIL